MNPYVQLGSRIGTHEAASLAERLTAWHDAMVAHERRLRLERKDDLCDDECPHVEARRLWTEAVATLGDRAAELQFLRAASQRRDHVRQIRGHHNPASHPIGHRTGEPDGKPGTV